MSLRNKLVSIIGVAALGFSLTAGIASADTADTDTVVNGLCLPVATITSTPLIEFDVDQTTFISGNSPAAQASRTFSAPGALQINVDTSCNWATWFVDTDITDFVNAAPDSGAAASFSGDRLSFNGGAFSGTGYDGITSLAPLAGPPTIIPTFAPRNIILDVPVTSAALTLLPSPGTTQATWNAQVGPLPLNLSSGEYVATMTLTLAVN